MPTKYYQFAKDIFPIWKEEIQHAEESILIFTPFLNNTLSKLIENTTLAKENITLVTDFSAHRLLEFPAQLKTIKSLRDKGLRIKHLIGLHAKVLVIDNKTIILGSQNFTSRGRKNKEASALLPSGKVEPHFLKKIHNWETEAIDIDPEWVAILLEKLSPLLTAHKKLLARADALEEICRTEMTERKNEALKQCLKDAIARSNLRLGKGVINAQVKERWSDAHWDYYYYLTPSAEDSFLNWMEQSPTGMWQKKKLKHLNFYPALITETMRMSFVRSGDKTITYFRSGVAWTQPYTCNGIDFKVTVSFPKTNTKHRNITITINEPYAKQTGCQLDLLFNGVSVTLIRCKFFKPFIKSGSDKILIKHLIDDSSALENFIADYLRSFRYAELGINRKNLRDYLHSICYRVALIEYKNIPIYIISNA